MPSDDRLASEAGWCEAVEIFPDIVADREILTTYVINIDVEPAQIVWGKRGVEVDERKSSLEEITKAKFKAVVDAEVAKETDAYPETQYDAAVVDAARIVFEARMDQIAVAATHEDVDALMEA
jgi:hypothetical protein